MPSYTIRAVSSTPPNKVHNDRYNSDTYYIRVLFNGVDKPVEIGKRNPDALKQGDTVEGDIISKPNFDADGFKQASTFQGGGQQQSFNRPSGNTAKPAYQPKDEHAIAKAVALKAAVDMANVTGANDGDVLQLANQFLNWLEDKDQLTTIPATPRTTGSSSKLDDKMSDSEWDSMLKQGLQADNIDLPEGF